MWFGGLIYVGMQAIASSSYELFGFLVLMALGGCFLMRKICFDLVDEVSDTGDALVVRNG
jgi:hypothetical protein